MFSVHQRKCTQQVQSIHLVVESGSNLKEISVEDTCYSQIKPDLILVNSYGQTLIKISASELPSMIINSK